MTTFVIYFVLSVTDLLVITVQYNNLINWSVNFLICSCLCFLSVLICRPIFIFLLASLVACGTGSIMLRATAVGVDEFGGGGG